MSLPSHQAKWQIFSMIRVVIVAFCFVAALVLPGLFPDEVRLISGKFSILSVALIAVAAIVALDQLIATIERNRDAESKRKLEEGISAHNEVQEKFQQDQISFQADQRKFQQELSKFQEELSKKQEERARYVDKYVGLLQDTIPVLTDIATYDVEHLERLAQTLLFRICQVAKLYRTGDSELDPGEQDYLNATFWLASANDRINPQQLGESATFLLPSTFPDSYPELLVLKLSANNNICVKLGFTLPVHEDPTRLLPGSVFAYRFGRAIAVKDIKNESEIRQLCADLDHTIQEALVRHFQNRRTYRSFASVPVVIEGHPIGAVNVQSMKAGYFTDGDETDYELLTYIAPFCTVLGYVGMCWVKRELEKMGMQGRTGV